jgi:hypothetical protein
MIHTYVRLVDTFSGCTHETIKTFSNESFYKLYKAIGTTKRRIENGVVFDWEIKDVRQATDNDYKRLNILSFENKVD